MHRGVIIRVLLEKTTKYFYLSCTQIYGLVHHLSPSGAYLGSCKPLHILKSLSISFGQSTVDEWVHFVRSCAERWGRSVCCMVGCAAKCVVMVILYFEEIVFLAHWEFHNCTAFPLLLVVPYLHEPFHSIRAEWVMVNVLCVVSCRRDCCTPMQRKSGGAGSNWMICFEQSLHEMSLLAS